MKNIEETRRIIAECFQLTLSLDTFGEDTTGLLHVELVSDDFSAKVIRFFYLCISIQFNHAKPQYRLHSIRSQMGRQIS